MILPIPDALAPALRDAPLVVVQAPAGFGKTTATRAALGAAGDLAWYDAQPWEADAFVETHVARVTGKLGVNSRARAVARAVALGLVNPAVAAV
jgi:ATP/maltotriose-dependent transcriptional regulator MalT